MMNIFRDLTVDLNKNKMTVIFLTDLTEDRETVFTEVF